MTRGILLFALHGPWLLVLGVPFGSVESGSPIASSTAGRATSTTDDVTSGTGLPPPIDNWYYQCPHTATFSDTPYLEARHGPAGSQDPFAPPDDDIPRLLARRDLASPGCAVVARSQLNTNAQNTARTARFVIRDDQEYVLDVRSNSPISRIEAWILDEEDLEWSRLLVFHPNHEAGPPLSSTVAFKSHHLGPAWGQFRIWFHGNTISMSVTVFEYDAQPLPLERTKPTSAAKRRTTAFASPTRVIRCQPCQM